MLQLPHLIRGRVAQTEASQLPTLCSSYFFHFPFGIVPILPTTAHSPGTALTPIRGDRCDDSPRGPCDTDCLIGSWAFRTISALFLANSPKVTPRALSQITYILLSPRWEPVSAGGWGGWGGVRKGLRLCTELILQGAS